MKDVDALLGAKVEIPKGHLFIAKTIHRLVYLTLILLPTTGLIIAVLFAYSLPGIDFAVGIHEFSAFLSYALIGIHICLLYTSPSPRDDQTSRMPSSA